MDRTSTRSTSWPSQDHPVVMIDVHSMSVRQAPWHLIQVISCTGVDTMRHPIMLLFKSILLLSFVGIIAAKCHVPDLSLIYTVGRWSLNGFSTYDCDTSKTSHSFSHGGFVKKKYCIDVPKDVLPLKSVTYKGHSKVTGYSKAGCTGKALLHGKYHKGSSWWKITDPSYYYLEQNVTSDIKSFRID
ncbi:hypothetical protein BJ138DRAFT_390284 [Hygrophoropsis aurantiaca]|uniref:Uncharacterized protein n=1 Tax=Hygrophoropsis aurantiaca TaxID=72124 RepID=A0ACB8A699_9AGAM|nr:hypothetical protein BJ138DRAFT_390284 [Hygrophoropsis aurantiaca]